MLHGVSKQEAFRLLRALKINESIGKVYFGTEKLIVEVGNIFCDTHKIPRKF